METTKPYHHGTLRRTLMDEALRSLERGGLEDLSLRALAERTGVSKTAPYRHFEDKRALLVALAAEGFRVLADALVPVDHGTDEPDMDDVLETARSYITFAQDHPALFRLMFSGLGYSLHSEECRANSLRAFGYLGGCVRLAQSLGWRKDEDFSALVLQVWAEVHGWAVLLIDRLIPEEILGQKADWEASLRSYFS